MSGNEEFQIILGGSMSNELAQATQPTRRREVQQLGPQHKATTNTKPKSRRPC